MQLLNYVYLQVAEKASLIPNPPIMKHTDRRDFLAMDRSRYQCSIGIRSRSVHHSERHLARLGMWRSNRALGSGVQSHRQSSRSIADCSHNMSWCLQEHSCTDSIADPK